MGPVVEDSATDSCRIDSTRAVAQRQESRFVQLTDKDEGTIDNSFCGQSIISQTSLNQKFYNKPKEEFEGPTTPTQIQSIFSSQMDDKSSNKIPQQQSQNFVQSTFIGPQQMN